MIKKHIPNALTCCNLLCGCVGIVEIFHGNMILSCILIGVAGIFDFFDGFAARLLKVTSPIGKDLDSLADVVTFGLLPSIIIYQLILRSTTSLSELWMPNIAFLIAIFSAVRLAKFNNDSRQSESFIGLPTPANGFLIASFPFLLNDNPDFWNPVIVDTTHLIIFTVVISYLLVAELPLLALKFKNFNWKGNEARYILIITSLLLIIIFQVAAVPMIILFYIVLSIITNWANRKVNL